MRLDSSGFLAPSELGRLGATQALHRGEGLPGAVWATGRALIWRELGVHFAHAELATAAGVSAAFGFPVFTRGALSAVVVLFVAGESSATGCVELWNLDEARGVLRHAGGHYVQCGELERMSMLLQFQRGVGLPGQVWRDAEPVLMTDVGMATSFIRGALARQLGLELGFGLPIFDGTSLTQVLTFLASAHEPFLRSVELWRTSPGELLLVAAKGSGMPLQTTLVMGDMLPGKVAQGGVPLAVTSATRTLRQPTTINLGLPIDTGGGVTHVACLRF